MPRQPVSTSSGTGTNTGPGTAALAAGAFSSGPGSVSADSDERLTRLAEEVLAVGCDLLAHSVACGAVATSRLVMGLLFSHGPWIQHLAASASGGAGAGGPFASAASGGPEGGRSASLLRSVLECCRSANESGHTLLHLAVLSRSAAMLRLVAVSWPLELGLPLEELNRPDRSGRSPVDYLMSYAGASAGGSVSGDDAFEREAEALLLSLGPAAANEGVAERVVATGPAPPSLRSSLAAALPLQSNSGPSSPSVAGLAWLPSAVANLASGVALAGLMDGQAGTTDGLGLSDGGRSSSDSPTAPRPAAPTMWRRLRVVLLGFRSPALEASYQTYKAARCRQQDILGLALHSIIMLPLIARTLSLWPAGGSLNAVEAVHLLPLLLATAVHVLTLALALFMPKFSRRRNKLLLLRAVLDIVLGLLIVCPGGRHGASRLPASDSWSGPWTGSCARGGALLQLAAFVHAVLELLWPLPTVAPSRQPCGGGGRVMPTAVYIASCLLVCLTVSLATDAYTRCRFVRGAQRAGTRVEPSGVPALASVSVSGSRS
ncbi:hypothetical protein GPECTOR_20g402 [Gonium pectorale]|uniref:Uncharacterized protein n=1 Tax=Gonium pectorale TaxID=33097 RepID=A0A150GI97_GONPE|nr:hypothetical protein GPECTOR_20g402 [Gonium pectorale]|eukprot:KXZ49548.1 hypothetical protein GPECTOR_20g402 [Gonium pectorale]